MALGRREIRAVFPPGLDEHAAFARAFCHNANRRSLSALEKANAIWKGVHVLQMEPSEIVETFGMSERQVNRYLELLDLGPELKRAVLERRLTMAHAHALRKEPPSEVPAWIERIERRQLSAADVREMVRTRERRKNPPPYVRREGEGFRIRAFRYSPSMTDAEKRRLYEALDQAMSLLRQTIGRS